RVDQRLRTLLQVHVVSTAQTHQRVSRAMGQTEIQTVRAPRPAGETGAGARRPTRSEAVSPLGIGRVARRLVHGSGVRWELHAQFCESRGVRFPSATHLVVAAPTRGDIERVKLTISNWLAERGLEFNEEKTRIVHVENGVDFLGFHIRRYSDGKVLVTPQKEK